MTKRKPVKAKPLLSQENWEKKYWEDIAKEKRDNNTKKQLQRQNPKFREKENQRDIANKQKKRSDPVWWAGELALERLRDKKNKVNHIISKRDKGTITEREENYLRKLGFTPRQRAEIKSIDRKLSRANDLNKTIVELFTRR